MFPLFLLSLLGIINTAYLHWQYTREKNLGKKMICLVGSSCFEVIDSKYGKTFGVKNETYGFIFYTLLTLYSTLATANSQITVLAPLIFILTLVGALFSIYLFIVQSMILKKYCSWCIVAIILNILIFSYIVIL